jgi:hypothetical protein
LTIYLQNYKFKDDLIEEFTNLTKEELFTKLLTPQDAIFNFIPESQLEEKEVNQNLPILKLF